MSRDNGLSMLDANQVIQEVHNETEKALDVITANSLVPKRYGKVDLEYITSGNGTGEVGAAKYYSDGVYQSQTITMHGDILGSSHKTTVLFYSRTPQNLSNTHFTIYEAGAPVTVWFNLDNSGTAPTTGNRLIEVNISSSDTEEQLAQKLNNKINTESVFFSVINGVMIMIVNTTSGIRKNSVDVNSGLVIKNIAGTEKQILDGKYFTLNSTSNTNQYYVWFNVGGASVDPTIPSRIGVEVSIASGATSADVVAATSAAILATNDFLTNTNEDKLTVINKTIGSSTVVQDVNCGFFVAINSLGSGRILTAHLVMAYDVDGNLTSVERL